MTAPSTTTSVDDHVLETNGRGGNGAGHPEVQPGATRRRPLVKLPTLTPFLIVNVLVVAAATIFVFSQLQPHLLFRNTTPSGGDMGAHVWQPAYMRDHLLPHFRLTGWTPDWYAGFPAMVFYFPLPSLAIVVLSVILPYSIAFKLVTVLGLLSLPVSAFAFGKLSGLKNPAPACLAAASLPFLFDRTFTIYGGNIPSTLAGEFAFSISLSLMFLFFGYFAKGLNDGRHRSLAAVLLALTGLCHMIPAIFAVGGAVILLLFRIDRHRLKWAVPVFATGAGLASFWAIPFMLRLPYTNDMGWEKIVEFRKTLFPDSFTWVLVLALLSVLVSALMRRRTGLFLSAMTLGTGIAFAVAPQGRLWNARLLPFWFLWIWMLVGLLVAELGVFLATAVRTTVLAESDTGPPVKVEPLARGIELATPIVAVLCSIVLVGFPLRVLPFGSTSGTNGKYTWLGITSSDRSFIPDWVRWNYSGYEDKGKPRHDEYAALVKVMSDVGDTEGCGRAMWEYEAEEDGFGTPMALMLLPHWTNGCIGSMEGLFFESSATTPYHFLNQSELSERPSRAMRNMPYRDLSVVTGAEHLQMLGVRYYMALTPAAQAQADTSSDLHLIASSGPWTVHYPNGDQQRTWKIYEVGQSEIVAPLTNQPDVMTNVDKGGKSWLAASTSWYQNRSRWDVPLAVSGPKDWKRLKVPLDPLGKPQTDIFGGQNVDTPRVPIPDPPTISKIVQKDDRISFDVSEVGKPVLVKASYFPNWKVSGAKGPWRVTPNQMVVIPTKKHVSLHYGYTPVDGLGWLATLLGLVGVVVMWRLGPVKYPVRPPRRRRFLIGPSRTSRDGDGDGDDAGDLDDAYSQALGRQLAGVNGGANGGPPVDVDSYWD